MKSMVMALAVGSVIAPVAAQSAEAEKTLQLRPKAALMSAVTPVSPGAQWVIAPVAAFCTEVSSLGDRVLCRRATDREASRTAPVSSVLALYAWLTV